MNKRSFKAQKVSVDEFYMQVEAFQQKLAKHIEQELEKFTENTGVHIEDLHLKVQNHFAIGTIGPDKQLVLVEAQTKYYPDIITPKRTAFVQKRK